VFKFISELNILKDNFNKNQEVIIDFKFVNRVEFTFIPEFYFSKLFDTNDEIHEVFEKIAKI
jgi:hypothetical protein